MTRCVRDVMTRVVVSVPRSARFKEIVRLLSTHRVSALPVVDAEGSRALGALGRSSLRPPVSLTEGGRHERTPVAHA